MTIKVERRAPLQIRARSGQRVVAQLVAGRGPQGEEGAPSTTPGPPGPANELTIGTVTEGPADADITGEAPNQVLHLVLPPGQPGAPGDDGTDGTDGTDGAAWYAGNGAPANALGVIGDWYINTANADLYRKTGANAWTLQLNIKGPAGSGDVTGPSGAANNRIALFDGTTGKLIKQAALVLADLATSTGGGQEKVAALSATTGTATGNLNNASVFTISPTGAFTLAFSNVPTGVAVTVSVIVTQGGTVRAMTMPSGTVWLQPMPTQVANKVCVVTILTVDGGTTWYATAAVQP